MEDLVYLKCVKEGPKLRVKIISSGYNQYANCQFPRDIRKDQCIYSVPREDVGFTDTRGKFFYRIKKNNIKIIDNKIENKIENIFESEGSDCTICMDSERDTIFSPCGHFCACRKCSSILFKTPGKCPMCRNVISCLVSPDELG